MGERMVAVNGSRLWVTEQGIGTPLILCNGGPGSCDYLGPVAAMVDDLAHVYRFEPRGCGRSSPDGPYDLATSLADLEALRVHFGHDRWIVGGHSWGAFLALVYALTHPTRTSALIYLAGTGIQNDREWHAAYQAGREAGLEEDPQFDYPPNMEVNRVGNASSRAYMKHPMLLRHLAMLDVPMLAIQGSQDIRPNWPVQQLANLMPHAQFELIDGAGHLLWLTHPDQLQSRLHALLEAILSCLPQPDAVPHAKGELRPCQPAMRS